jgi:hypothetical protein
LPRGPLLSASVDPFPSLEFELGADDEGINVFVDPTIHSARLDVDLRTFPRKRLAADYGRPSWRKDVPEGPS